MANVIGTRVCVVVERHELSDTGSRNSSSIAFNCSKKSISSMLYLDTKFVRN